jgi:hypothetical protein
LQLSHGQNSLKSWLEEFSRSGGLVSQSAPQENAKQPKMNGGSSTSLQMELPLCDRESYSLKTSKDSFQPRCQMDLQSLATASRDWKAYITELRQAYSARLKSAHRISESGCSSWPSPVASEVRQGFQDRSRGMKGSQESLTTVVVKSWPTPAARDHKDTGENVDMEKVAAKSKLAGVVAVHGPAVPASISTDGSRRELSVDWRTPQANEAGAKVETLYTKDGQPAKPGQRAYRKTPDGRMVLQSQTINQQVEMVQNWATPRAEMDSGAHRGKPDTLHSQMKVQAVGKLNPRWVCTLMNVPVFWVKP